MFHVFTDYTVIELGDLSDTNDTCTLFFSYRVKYKFLDSKYSDKHPIEK